MNRPNHIMDVMRKQHGGCWYSFGGKEPVYENIVLDPVIWDNTVNDTIPNPYEIPSKEFLEAELVRLQAKWDVDQIEKEENLVSAKAKLENLGLTVDEIKEAFGI